MFSSSPFPELPSSPNVFLPQSFFFDYEKDDVCFNYNQNNSDPFISYDCFFRSPSPVMENITTMKQDFVSQQEQFSEEPWLQYSCEEHDDLLDSVISSTKSKKKVGSSKKDGHSKIYTAQGPRDRRVRLSIDISRKFFCLQDLLGFDKASKTLDWLFSKSKTAIKELIEETSRCPSSSVTDQSKASFLEAIKRGLDDEDKGKKKKSDMSKCVDGKRKKMTQKSRGGFQENFTRDQSRAMARARARERTREKMHIKKLDDDLKAVVVPDDFDTQNMEYCNGGGNHKAILTANGLLIADRWAVLNGGSELML